jgi:putative ABC transport system permease protein
MIFEAFITAYFGQKWNVPIVELMVVLMAIFLSAIVAVYGPAKRMRNMAIIDTINEL